MSSHFSPKFSALISGGSVGGLAAGLELRNIGAEVTIFERSVGSIEARGAGIVIQQEVEDLLHRIGSSAEAVSVPLYSRQRIDKAGNVRSVHSPQLMTSWGALHRTLSAALKPDVDYLLGHELETVQQQDTSITASFTNGSSAHGDLLVGADGIGSAVRQALANNAKTGTDQAQYAGYVAWRGLEPESTLPKKIVKFLEDSFTFFAVPGLQFLSYLVPGPHGETAPGSRQVNWVWYINSSELALQNMLIGKSGKQFNWFLPPGEAQASVLEALHQLAKEQLPPILHDLVVASRPFMQPVADLPYTRMVDGRAVLIGDAAGTVRPHTAFGTAKAFDDAHLLSVVLDGWDSSKPFPTARLSEWETHRGQSLKQVATHGMQFASGTMLGNNLQTTSLQSTRPQFLSTLEHHD